MQFPWRWMLCLGVRSVCWPRWNAAMDSRVASSSMSASCVLVVRLAPLPGTVVGQHLRSPRDAGQHGHRSGIRRHGRIHATGADPSAVDKDARRVTVGGSAHAAIRVLQWTAQPKSFTADMSTPITRLTSIQLSGVAGGSERTPVPADTREGTGQMLIPVETGMNRVRITFARTWDRTAGAWISLLARRTGAAYFRRPSLNYRFRHLPFRKFVTHAKNSDRDLEPWKAA